MAVRIIGAESNFMIGPNLPQLQNIFLKKIETASINIYKRKINITQTDMSPIKVKVEGC